MHGSVRRFEGDPDDLEQRYLRMFADVPESNHTFHAAAKTPDGLLIFDTCPSEDVYRQFFGPGGPAAALFETHGLLPATREDYPSSAPTRPVRESTSARTDLPPALRRVRVAPPAVLAGEEVSHCLRPRGSVLGLEEREVIRAGEQDERRVRKRVGDLAGGRLAERVELARDHERGRVHPGERGALIHPGSDVLVEVAERIGIRTGAIDQLA